MVLAKSLIWFCAVAVVAYVALCALLFLKQGDLIYYPSQTLLRAEDTDFSMVRNGVTLRGWRVNPGKAGAVLYFGGNAEQIGSSRAEFARLFPNRTIYLVSYRGYGASEGTPDQQTLFADALALYDHVAGRHSPSSIAVIGRSLGSGVASYLASQRQVEKLALVTPFDSLAAVAQSHYPFFPVRWLMRDSYESTRYLPRYDGPVLILRAGRDSVVPPANTDVLQASMGRKTQVMNFPQADHNNISNDPRYAEALRNFLR